jgi:hypothetical protein
MSGSERGVEEQSFAPTRHGSEHGATIGEANNDPTSPVVTASSTPAAEKRGRRRRYASDLLILRFVSIPQLGHRYTISSPASTNMVGTIVLILIGPSQRGQRGASRAAKRVSLAS